MSETLGRPQSERISTTVSKQWESDALPHINIGNKCCIHLRSQKAQCIVTDSEDLWVGTTWFDACWHGETDCCAWRISCGLGWWQETCSCCCVYCSKKGVINNWQIICILLLEKQPWVTISIKQFRAELFLLSFWYNCYPYKPVHQTSVGCCVIM